MATHFEMTKSWGKLRIMLDPSKFHAALDPNIRKATKFNALLVRREARTRITDGVYAPNRSLTIVIKGSSKPLVDNADLMNAITDEMINSFTAWVGVKREARGKEGQLFNLAVMLHEGGSIPVTPSMRNLFMILYEATTGKLDPSKLTGRAAELYEQWNKSRKGPIYPLKPSTSSLVIPGRPFLRSVFDDKGIQAKVKANWQKAVEATIKGMGET